MAIDFPGADRIFAEARKSKTTLIYKGGAMVFDIVTPRTDTLTNQITENAVESGALIADHITRLPRSFTFDFVITETPVTFGVGNLPVIGQAVPKVRNLLDGSADSAAASRVAKIVNQLIQLRDERVALTITGRYYDVPSVYIEDLSLTVSSEGGESVSGTLTLRQVVFVQTAEAAIADRALASAVQPTAEEPKAAGVQKATEAKGAAKKAAKKAADTVVETSKSMIKGIVDGVKKVFTGG